PRGAVWPRSGGYIDLDSLSRISPRRSRRAIRRLLRREKCGMMLCPLGTLHKNYIMFLVAVVVLGVGMVCIFFDGLLFGDYCVEFLWWGLFFLTDVFYLGLGVCVL